MLKNFWTIFKAKPKEPEFVVLANGDKLYPDGRLVVDHEANRRFAEEINGNKILVGDASTELINQYGGLSVEEILLHESLSSTVKASLLTQVHGYKFEEADDLIKSATKVERKAKLRAIKRKVYEKAQDLYGQFLDEQEREPIPDDVKSFVWQRDKGRCVKCGSNEKLEFDHIIPFSKGGSNTARNLQLLCEKCNREKGATI